MKTQSASGMISNRWLYYLIKWGAVPRGKLILKTGPDPLVLEIDGDLLKRARGVLKSFFALIRAREFEYDGSTRQMTVYSEKRRSCKRSFFDLFHIDTIRFCLDNDIDCAESDDSGCFMVSVKGMKFYARKAMAADAQVIKMVCIDDEYGFLLQYIKDKVVVDIGANIGDTATYFLARGARRVIAFEPHEYFYRQAQRNLKLNGLEGRVDLRNAGVGSVDGVETVVEDGNFGPGAGFGLRGASFGRRIPIQVVSIGKVIDEHGPIDVLKMDCEGAEFDIVGSLSTDQLRKIGVIGLEYHRDPAPIIRKLESARFAVRTVRAVTEEIGLLLAVKEER